jgi:hypothetical protein
VVFVEDRAPGTVARALRRAIDALDVTSGPTLCVTVLPGRLLVVAHALSLDAHSVEHVADELAAGLVPDASHVRAAEGRSSLDAAPSVFSASSALPAGGADPRVWIEALGGAVAAGIPGAGAVGTAADPGLFTAAVLTAPASAEILRAAAGEAFLAALRARTSDAGTLVVDRLVDPRRFVQDAPDTSGAVAAPLGAHSFVYPLAFPASGPLPDIAAWDVLGAGYHRLRHGSRAGARELGRVARAAVVLRDAASRGWAPDVPPAGGTRWAIEASIAVGPDEGGVRCCRLALVSTPDADAEEARRLFGAWVAEATTRIPDAVASSTTETTTPTTDTGRTT